MHLEHHRWYSPRLNREMGVVVCGHFGRPIVTFPTSGGNEWEYHDQGLLDSVGDFIEQLGEMGAQLPGGYRLRHR